MLQHLIAQLQDHVLLSNRSVAPVLCTSLCQSGFYTNLTGKPGTASSCSTLSHKGPL